MKVIYVRVDNTLHRQIRVRAKTKGLSLQKFVVSVLEHIVSRG